MIFVTVGTQLPFDRLVSVVDEWAGAHGISGFAQIGPGKYLPRHMAFDRFIGPDSFEERVRSARCIISHAGMGSIISALSHAKPAIMMARRFELGEHRNDHQRATAAKFSGRPHLRFIDDVAELDAAYRSLIDGPDVPEAISPYADGGFIQRLTELVFNGGAVK